MTPLQPFLASQRKRESSFATWLTIVKRHASSSSAPSPVPVVPYSALTVGVPRETHPNERRVALTPQNVALLRKKGFSRVLVERGAGEEAQLLDHAYEEAGATLVESSAIWSESDIVLKVRSPRQDGPVSEVNALRQGTTVISFLYPAQNKPLVESLASRGVTTFAIDMVPRISRAQVFDALRLVSQRLQQTFTDVGDAALWPTLPDIKLSWKPRIILAGF